jgi:DNA (cytosine-5)-methyltransferase 1
MASEIDQHAVGVYSHNWQSKNPTFQIEGDIRSLTEGPKVIIPSHDVLTGGFPCQPFSKSGNQLGVNETRGTLFYNILRVIESRKPKMVLLENVRNLVGPKHHEDYLAMVKLLRELGYAVSTEPTILSPHEIEKSKGGTPQHRDRVFIGAIHVGKSRAQKLTDLGPLISRQEIKENCPSWDLKNYLQEINSNKIFDKGKLRIPVQQEEALTMWNEFLLRYRKVNKKNPPGFPMWTDYWQERRSLRIPVNTPEWKRNFINKNAFLYESNSKWIDSWRVKYKLEECIPSLRKFEWQAGDMDSIFSGLIQFRPSGVRVKAPNYVPAFVAITQTPVLGWELRELSVFEAASLQGFPFDFDFDSQRRTLSLKQIGNAVHAGAAAIVFESMVRRANSLDIPWAEEFQ